MKITCPACNASYRLPDERIQGKNRIFKINCKKCSAEIRVRGVETAEEIGRTTMPFALELPAPAAAPQVWFAGIDGKQVGPLTEAELGEHVVAGRLGPADLVWKKGFSQWMPVREVPPFADMLAEAPVAGEEPKPAEKRSPRRAQTLELSAAMIELLVKLDGQSEGADSPPAVPVEPPALPPLDPEPVLTSASLDRASAIAGEHADADRMDAVVETILSPVPTVPAARKAEQKPAGIKAKADEAKAPPVPSSAKAQEARPAPDGKHDAKPAADVKAAHEPKSADKPADKKPSVVVKAAPVVAPATPSRPQIQPVESARPATAPAKAGTAPAKAAAAPAKSATAAPAKAGTPAARTPAAAARPADKKKGGGLYVAAAVAVVIVLVVVAVVASQNGKSEAATPAPAAAVASVAPVAVEKAAPVAVAPVVAAAAGAQADAGAAVESDVAVAAAAADVAAEAPKVEEKKEEAKADSKKDEAAAADKKADDHKKDEAKADKKADAKKDDAKKEDAKKDDADAILAKREAKEKAAQEAQARKQEAEAKKEAAKADKEAAKAAKEQAAKDAAAAKEAAKAAKEQAAKDKAAAKKGGGDDIDEILARHEKKAKPADDTASDDEGGLNQAQVNQIASKVNKKVLTCVMLGEVEGETALKVTVRVNSDGSVNNAKVLGKFGGTPVAKCVADAVQTLTFPQSSGPAKKYTLKYAVGN